MVDEDDGEDLPTLAAGRWTDADVPLPTDDPYAPGPAAPSPWAAVGPPVATAPVAPDPAPGPRRDRMRMVGAIVLVAIIAAGIGFVSTLAVLDSHDSTPAAVSVPGNGSGGSATPTPTRPVQPTDPDSAVLGDLILQQNDVPPGAIVVLRPDGTDAVGTATLDLCNGTFPSESTRTSRRQVVSGTATGDTALSTEAVLYRTPADAVRAFADLRKVVATCPPRPVTSPVGEETVTTKFNAPPDATWPKTPKVDRLAYDLTTRNTAGESNRSIAVYLRNGRALMGLYFPAVGPQSPVDGKTAIPDIVTIFAKRLAALPADVVNG